MAARSRHRAPRRALETGRVAKRRDRDEARMRQQRAHAGALVGTVLEHQRAARIERTPRADRDPAQRLQSAAAAVEREPGLETDLAVLEPAISALDVRRVAEDQIEPPGAQVAEPVRDDEFHAGHAVRGSVAL